MYLVTEGKWSFPTMFNDSKALSPAELVEPLRVLTYGIKYELVDAIQRRNQKGKTVIQGGMISAPIVCPCKVNQARAQANK